MAKQFHTPSHWTIEERLEYHSVPEPMSGCHLWHGSYNGDRPVIIMDEKSILAYRESYKKHKGKIEEGLVVRHMCNNCACVNPDHLKLGTQKDNVHDMLKSGRKRLRKKYEGPLIKVKWWE